MRSALAQSSHLMIWSDNDIANDFTELGGKYSQAFLMAAMQVYTSYQRQLWDPKCNGRISMDAESLRTSMEEWHFHTYGRLGMYASP